MAGFRIDFRGLMAAPFTPMKPDGSLNEDVIPEYSEFLRKENITGVFVNGTTGEGVSLTVPERKRALEAWMKTRRDGVPCVIAHVGALTVDDTTELARHAESIGVSGIGTLPPLYFRPSSVQQLVDYCRHVGAAAPNTPLIYYHIPTYTNTDVNMSEFLELAGSRIPTFCGAKFTCVDLLEGAKCLDAGEGSFQIFLGADELLLPALSLGFTLAIGCTYNFLPRPSLQIIASLQSGDLGEAARHQKVVRKAMIAINSAGGAGVQAWKAAMSELTPIKVGPPRLPLTALTPEQLDTMKEALAKLGIHKLK